MSEVRVPEGMLKAATVAYNAKTCSMGYKYVIDRNVTEATLEAALRWLVEIILHESNADFHRAILQRGQERYPDNIVQRVAFEFGVSFARHYIRHIFLAEPEMPPVIKHLLEWQDRSAKISETETKERILEAYRIGLKDGKQ